MPLADDIRQLLSPLTGPGGDWEVTEQEVLGYTQKVFKNSPANLVEFFETQCQEFADDTFLVFEDQRITFAEFWQQASALANALQQDYNVKQGERVAVLGRNYPEWLVGYCGALALGAIPVPMNAWWVAKELEYGINDCGCSVIIIDQQRLQRFRECSDINNSNIQLIGMNLENETGIAEVSQLVQKYMGQARPDITIDIDDPAHIMYTSGTTGFPKGALSSHRNIMTALQTLAFAGSAAEFVAPDIAAKAKEIGQQSLLLTVPLFHVTGCVAISLLSIAVGRKTTFMYKWDAEEALKLIERERCTAFTGVPTMTWEMMRVKNFDKYDTSTLLTVGGGGAPAPAEQVKKVDEKFVNGSAGIGYGLTETNAVISTNTGALYLLKPTSCGMPNALGDVKITDENGNSLPANTEGEVCIKGPFVFQGYWNKEEATNDAFYDEWFRSGDVGYLDDDGFLYICDRQKDMILRGGENVYCAEIEGAIYQHPDVDECTAFGVPDARLGERVAVAIVVEEGCALTAESLQEFLADKLAKFKIPEIVEFRTEKLPRGDTEKILKRVIRDDYTVQFRNQGLLSE